MIGSSGKLYLAAGPPLTPEFRGMPAEHDGGGPFAFEIVFSRSATAADAEEGTNAVMEFAVRLGRASWDGDSDYRPIDGGVC